MLSQQYCLQSAQEGQEQTLTLHSTISLKAEVFPCYGIGIFPLFFLNTNTKEKESTVYDRYLKRSRKYFFPCTFLMHVNFIYIQHQFLSIYSQQSSDECISVYEGC